MRFDTPPSRRIGLHLEKTEILRARLLPATQGMKSPCEVVVQRRRILKPKGLFEKERRPLKLSSLIRVACAVKKHECLVGPIALRSYIYGGTEDPAEDKHEQHGAHGTIVPRHILRSVDDTHGGNPERAVPYIEKQRHVSSE